MYEQAYLIQCKMGIIFLKFIKTHPDYAAFSKSNPMEVRRARRMCADALSLAKTIKNQLRNQFTEELKLFKIRQEREKAEEEARKAKEEMRKMEAERRRLEAESEAAQQEIDEMNEESRRQQAEAERQELIRIYGDQHKIVQEVTAPTSRPPTPPFTVPEEPMIESPQQLKDKENETVLSNESVEKECNICFEPFDSDRRRVMCFFPCGHARTCQDCFNSFKGRKECPECRIEIEQAIVAFF